MELNCRVCLQLRDVMVDLYEEVEHFHTDLASLLENCGGMFVDEHDPFPKYLCQECTQELFAAAEFREKCKLATKMLQEMQQKPMVSTTTVHSPKKNSTTESPLLYEPVIVDDDGNKVCVTDYTIDHSPKLEAVEINIVFDSEQNKESVTKPSTNNSADNSIGNVIQLVLPQDTQEHNNVIEENLNEVDVVTTDADEYVKVYDSVDFADSIIEELENEENEIGAEQIDVVYPTTTLKPTENFNFVCNACGASFVKALNLRRHMEIEHQTILEFLCEKCERKFDTEKDYERHLDLCSSEQRDESTKPLSKVAENKKKANQATKHMCDYCGKCLQSSFSLRMHIRTHTGERPFSCDKCQSQFKTQAALTAHERRHVGNADLICEVCEKRFIEPSNLIAHRRTHTGERPHTCNVCFKSFSRVYLLQLHMRTHTGEKPYKCELCLKTFSQSADLKYHLATHSRDRKFTCPMCPKSYIRRNKLEQHLEKHNMSTAQQSDSTDMTEDSTLFSANYKTDTEMDDVNVNEDDIY